MPEKKRQVSVELIVELEVGERPALWIARQGGSRVRIELSEVPHLAQVLSGVAADLIGYQVGEHVFVGQENNADWRKLIGQIVKMPGGRRGKVMGPVGDWSKPYERGCLLVSFADQRPTVCHLDDIAQSDR